MRFINQSGGNAGRFLVLVLAAASLAACAQSSVVSRRSEFSPSRQAALERHEYRRATPRIMVAKKYDEPFLPKSTGSQGLASYYTEGTKTASGEAFNSDALTAAHPNLPFGTKLRVTNTTTGKSVVVRVNDRGPFVKGRVVDVSYSAAQALGMVNSGTANVKLDVVQ
jgi:peptidoglycan lytic transglycosylase